MSGIKNALVSTASLLLGRETAAAACPPDGFYEKACIQGYRYKRYCYTKGDCSGIECGPYVATGATC